MKYKDMSLREAMKVWPIYDKIEDLQEKGVLNGKIIKCSKCGSDQFIVLIEVIIDDAELICANCGHQQI